MGMPNDFIFVSTVLSSWDLRFLSLLSAFSMFISIHFGKIIRAKSKKYSNNYIEAALYRQRWHDCPNRTLGCQAVPPHISAKCSLICWCMKVWIWHTKGTLECRCIMHESVGCSEAENMRVRDSLYVYEQRKGNRYNKSWLTLSCRCWGRLLSGGGFKHSSVLSGEWTWIRGWPTIYINVLPSWNCQVIWCVWEGRAQNITCGKRHERVSLETEFEELYMLKSRTLHFIV